jgi:3-oxoacyl-[acyl-carrier-protein] synthase-1
VETVINRAITQAGIDSNQIDLVKAHGTASLHNDDAEADGLRRVFPKVPPIVIIKPYIGHTLGACGINELILFYHSVIGNKLSDLSRSQSISSDFELQLAQKEDYTGRGYFLLNYFGFGGNNTALIIGNA